MEELDVSALLRESCALVAPLANSKGITLSLNVPEAPVRFRTDGRKFRQIVFNLTANAVKWTKTGAVTVSLVDAQDEVLLRVADTGTGISPADAERLFDSFWQARSSDAAQSGTGLGLTITRQLAQLLGGEVELESSGDGGSTFLVRFPVDRRHSRALHEGGRGPASASLAVSRTRA